MSKNRVIALQKKLARYPMGDRLFSYLVARMAPYFTTIKPRILELKPNYIKVAMKKRRAVENHLGTVHAIASCNLCEFAAGICMEASIPTHRRWIPTGMNVSYLQKAKTDVTADCDLSFVSWSDCTQVICPVSVVDNSGTVVVQADITMKVSDKKAKSTIK